MSKAGLTQHILGTAFVTCCAFWYLRVTVWKVIPELDARPSDYRAYYDASRNVLAGRSPYTDVNYIYPPLAALLNTPLALLDYVPARRIWFVLSQGMLLIAAWLMWRISGRSWPAACWIALVWAAGGSAGESLALGQLGPLLTLVVVMASTGAPRRMGTAIGLGFALKIIPAILLPALVLGRNRRAMRAAAIAVAAGLGVPWILVAFGLRGPSSPSGSATWTGTAATLSWSVPSVVLRALDPPATGTELPRSWQVGADLPNVQLPLRLRLASVAVILVILAGGVAAFAMAVRGRLSREQMPVAVTALIALGLAASPVCWTHYEVMQYPGVALMLCAAWRPRRWGLLAAALVLGACLYPLPVAILRDYYTRHSGWTAASPATLYLWTSVTPAASLVLFGLLTREARRMGTHAVEKPVSTR
jgi:hypothetical protein